MSKENETDPSKTKIKYKDWKHDSGLTCSSGTAEFGAIEVNTAQSNLK